MNKLIVLLLAVTIAMAWDADEGPRNSIAPMNTQGYDDISTVVVNDFVMSGVTSPRGIDYGDSWAVLFMTDYGSDSFYTVDPSSGAITATYAVDSAIPDVLGAVYDLASLSLFVNDWGSVMDIWYYHNSSWTFGFTGPYTGEPRGMAMDEAGTIWGMDADTHVLYNFTTSGTVIDSWDLNALVPSGYSCGIAVFPYDGDLGIVMGGYSWTDFYYFRWDGVNMVLLGTSSTPQSASSSYGLTYSSDLDSFFWLYRDGSSQYHLIQFDITITALQRETWAGIKSAF